MLHPEAEERKADAARSQADVSPMPLCGWSTRCHECSEVGTYAAHAKFRTGKERISLSWRICKSPGGQVVVINKPRDSEFDVSEWMHGGWECEKFDNQLFMKIRKDDKHASRAYCQQWQPAIALEVSQWHRNMCTRTWGLSQNELAHTVGSFEGSKMQMDQ